MGKTRIEWATDTWPVITGCSPVSEGCRNCYAARLAATRLKHHPHYAGLAQMVNGHPQWTGEVRFNEDALEQPLRWKKPRVVFPCSMADWLHPQIPHEWQVRMLDVMADERCQQHTFLLLTKRPENYEELVLWLSEFWPGDTPISTCLEVDGRLPPNVWLGVTVESQDQMWRVDQLLSMPMARHGAKHFVSCEPLLGPVDLNRAVLIGAGGHNLPLRYIGLDGVIIGGESGSGARPMNPDWVRSIRDQCVEAGVAFMFKQWGEWQGMDYDGRRIGSAGAECFRWSGEPMPPPLPGEDFKENFRFSPSVGAMRMGKKRAGRSVDGKIWDEFPWSLIKEA